LAGTIAVDALDELAARAIVSLARWHRPPTWFGFLFDPGLTDEIAGGT
jgi:hypothetical protein